MRPIPRVLLPHAVTLARATVGERGALALTAVAALSYVRLDTSETETLTDDDTQRGRSAVLFYDVRNSCPRGVAFAPGQYVLQGNRRYRVETVEPLYDGARLHHIEITLTE